MPIVVPPPSGYPVDTGSELATNRALTKAFIDSAPVEIQLIPQVEQKLPSGGVRMTDGDPRPLQTFRLIPMDHTDRPVRSSSVAQAADDGVQRRYDYTLLGEWNADMSEKDKWVSPEGQILVIDSIVSFNGYERKGMVTSYGRSPAHG